MLSDDYCPGKAQNGIAAAVLKQINHRLDPKSAIDADTCKIKTHKSVLF